MRDFIKKALKKPFETSNPRNCRFAQYKLTFLIFLKVGVKQAFNRNTLKNYKTAESPEGPAGHISREKYYFIPPADRIVLAHQFSVDHWIGPI